MKLKFTSLLVPILLLATACAPGATAISQPEATSDISPTASQPLVTSRQPETSIPARVQTEVGPTVIILIATPTPGPVPVVQPTATPVFAVPAPLPTSIPVSRATSTPAPAPQPTRVPVDPLATPTPLWQFIPTPTPTPTPSPTPFPVATTFVPSQVVAAAPGEEFQSVLSYHYALPSHWSAVNTGSSVVLHDPTRLTTVTISEKQIERWRYATVYIYGFENTPPKPEAWDVWSQDSTEGLWKEQIFEAVYSGVKNGIAYVNVRRSFLWGELHVEASLEIPLALWENEGGLYETAIGVLESFRPHSDSELMSTQEALAALAVRMEDRFSGIYGRDESIPARVELTCKDIFEDSVQTPVFQGHGVWQVFAPTLEGTESWEIYEPTGAVKAATSNRSNC